MRDRDSLATILLTSRMHSEGVKPLAAGEYWKLLEHVRHPGVLLGMREDELVEHQDLSREWAKRIVSLLDRARAMAFELEKLDHAGVRTITSFDDHYPVSLVDRLGSRAPALIHAAGPLELFGQPGMGIVGSRDVSPEGAEVARDFSAKAVEMGSSVISGGARGVDQVAMNAAFQAGGNVIGVVADSLMKGLRKPDVRRAIYDEQVLMCTPYAPEAPFKVWNAMGRNKLIYALSNVTVVVTGEVGRGGTWSGAVEALKGGFGRVAVWRGPGEGPGNAVLQERGAQPIRSVNELEEVLGSADQAVEKPSASGVSDVAQLSLFGRTA